MFYKKELFRSLGKDIQVGVLQTKRGAARWHDKNGWYPLHQACCRDAPLDVVKLLVRQYPEALAKCNSFGQLPLHLACGRFHDMSETIRLLVQAWPYAVFDSDKDGNLPLHCACSAGQSTETIDLLIRTWPDSVKRKNHGWYLPLSIACNMTDTEKVETRLQNVRLLLDYYPEGASTFKLDFRGTETGRARVVENAIHPLLEAAKDGTLPRQTPPAKATPGFSRPNAQLSNGTSDELSSMIRVLSILNVRLVNQIPRLFVLLPARLDSRHQRPIFAGMFKKHYHLYFVCAATYQPVAPPLVLKKNRTWVKRIAPALVASLYVLKLGLSMSPLNLNLPVPEGTDALLDLTQDRVVNMLSELGNLLRNTKESGLVERLDSQSLTVHDVQELSGEAYDLVVQEARQQSGGSCPRATACRC